MLSVAYTVTMKNNHIKSPLSASQRKRIVRLLLAAGCFVLLSFVGVNSSFESHQLLYNSADNTAKSLTSFMALNAKEPLLAKNKPQLRALCNDISKDEFVLSATIYDQQGVLIASSDHWQSDHHKNRRSVHKDG